MSIRTSNAPYQRSLHLNLERKGFEVTQQYKRSALFTIEASPIYSWSANQVTTSNVTAGPQKSPFRTIVIQYDQPPEHPTSNNLVTRNGNNARDGT